MIEDLKEIFELSRHQVQKQKRENNKVIKETLEECQFLLSLFYFLPEEFNTRIEYQEDRPYVAILDHIRLTPIYKLTKMYGEELFKCKVVGLFNEEGNHTLKEVANELGKIGLK